ncbi:trace amine-associated receptor 13c-like [Lepisosteus oculatus]|uniref:trace amine-associated receptor 13c-like n=1 Tax=Lepisosteus oculatus TaxID=7918 RepID=UPI0035F50079
MEPSDSEILQSVQYCFPSNNASCRKEQRSASAYSALYTGMGATVVLTVCGNLLVIISISHFKQLHTPTNLILLSLAVADFLVGMTVLPLTMTALIETCWYFGGMLCSLYLLLDSVLISVSLSNLVLIAIDRYFAICDPLFYSTKISVNLMHLLILFSWHVRLISSFKDKNKETTYKISKISERKAAKTLGIVVFVFFFCWLPYYIWTFTSTNVNMSLITFYFSPVVIVYLNSCINPIIYALFYPWFQKSVKLILTFKICYRESSFVNLFPDHN